MSWSADGASPAICIFSWETIMKKLVHASALVLAIIGSASFAAAQSTQNQQTYSSHPNLTSSQQQQVGQGLASSPSQAAPSGAQPQVGDKVPDSMTAQDLPGNVTNQIPEVKTLLFVKLPDRILLIDPDTKRVSQIVTDADSLTTGSNAASNPGSTDRPARQ
jgi:hypothetical protein